MEQGLMFRVRLASRGFSLVELLLVVALIGILATLGIMEFSSVVRGSRLTSAGRLLQSEISLAKQQAVTFHQEVEVRLFQTGGTWNGIALVIRDATGAEKLLRRPMLLPEGVVMDAGQSPLLTSAPISNRAVFATHGEQDFRAFRFRSGGNTQPELTSTNNTLLLRGGTPGEGTNLVNYRVVAVTPVNGKATIYQP
jgi:uncharacterized protein (TIGR02596 family)